MRREGRGAAQAALALVATVVGAGFASGREVLRFFCAFGSWSWVGCAAAAVALACVSAWTARTAARLDARDLATMCLRALGGWGGIAAAWVNGLLVTATAGAMLAAMGELAALSLPILHAREIGIAAALVLGAVLAGRGLSALAAAGGWLLPVCALLYALLLGLPSAGPVAPPSPDGWRALPLALTYAAMNAAIGSGVLCELGRGRAVRATWRACVLAGALFLLLLLLANAALLPSAGELRDAALPAVVRARGLGATGYWLCVAALSLAVLTTLTALLRTLANMLSDRLPRPAVWPLTLLPTLILAVSGFDTLVDHIYPVLGALSTLLFLAVLLSASGKRRKPAGPDNCLRADADRGAC